MYRRLLTFFSASEMALSYKGQGASLVNDTFVLTFHHKSLLQVKKQPATRVSSLSIAFLINNKIREYLRFTFALLQKVKSQDVGPKRSKSLYCTLKNHTNSYFSHYSFLHPPWLRDYTPHTPPSPLVLEDHLQSP